VSAAGAQLSTTYEEEIDDMTLIARFDGAGRPGVIPCTPILVFALILAGSGAVRCLAAQAASDASPPLSTFSVVACDPASGQLGVAVQSRVVAAGAIVPAARAGVGAIATQANANVTFKPRTLQLLAEGRTPEEVKQQFIEADSLIESRQFAIVDAGCRMANFTGERNIAWAGMRSGEHYSVQGNILVGAAVVDSMAAAFERAEAMGKPLAERMLDALKAGQAAGGDRRGRQGAGLLVVQQDGGYGGGDDRYIDLRVEDHVAPILELERVYRVFMSVFHPNDIYQPLGSRPIYPQRGPDIRELQEKLAALGYYGGEFNGRLDAATLTALDAFQADHGLTERGYVGDRTVAELERAASGSQR
jgi:uncharacterized Ntn-hydrolase superfamily protein